MNIWEIKKDLEERRIEIMKNNEMRYNEIAKKLSSEFNMEISGSAVRSRFRRAGTPNVRRGDYKISNAAQFKSNVEDVVVLKNVNKQINEEKLFPTECYDAHIEKCMAVNKKEDLKEVYEAIMDINPRKILSISDLHSPFTDFYAIEKAIREHVDADMLVLNGDVFDGNPMSKYDGCKTLTMADEIEVIYKLLDKLSTMFKLIVWVGGNHDMKRFRAYIAKNMKDGMKDFALTHLNPSKIIADRYKNVLIVEHDWVQIGDVVFAHMAHFSTTDMKTVINTSDRLFAHKHFLPKKNLKTIVIGHTHHLGKIIRNDITLVEQGCVCNVMDYKFLDPTKVKWQKGYAVVHLDENGNSNFNTTHCYSIEEEG